MRAAVYKSKQNLVVEEIPTPEPQSDEVQIKISHSAICGTDVHVYLYDIAPPDTVLGHEFAGEISKVGSDVTRFKVGDRVIGLGGTPPPGKESPLRRQDQYNYRLEGITNTRTRGYAEYTVAKEWEPLRLPDQVSNLEGALAEPCAIVTRAVRLSNQKLGDTVAVLGAGPIGLLCLQAAKAAGATKVIVSEPSEARRAVALELGADAVVDPTSQDPVKAIIELTDGAGPHVVYECAAAKPTLHDALDMVRRKGNVMLVALAWEDVPLLPVDWAGKEIQLNTTFASEPYDFKVAVDLIASKKFVLEPLLSDTDTIELKDIQEAFESLIKPSNQIQMVIKF
jgi:(R,R)-butanediol dehydrogenase/meso-butanediol dehydrogenase/diacetyl reductase|tara:strand:- start:3423 stop:4439 length:1017 start_codon:yes stop_codon:yes gene_type:complete